MNANQKRCDALWSLAIKARAGQKSELSGSPKNLRAHHVFQKGNLLLRYSLDNGICLTESEHTAAHSTVAGKARVHRTLTPETIEALSLLKFKICTDMDWDSLEKSLKSAIKEFEA